MTRNHYHSNFKIRDRGVSISDPTYFIADIAANHDGDLARAKDLIWRAKEAGADCAKFQHFLPNKIASDKGFSYLGQQISHQSSWRNSVVEIYDQYHTRRNWTEEIVQTCRDAEIEFMTTPYDFEAIDTFSDIVPAFKVGSGDITYHTALQRMAAAGKPVLLATGAANMDEAITAAELILEENPNLCVMQCNTNYTGSFDNFQYVNLNVLKSFALRWPNMVLGLSDHTPGHSAVLGAVALGARIIEKHFTDDNSREGPDHSFALNPTTWRNMVDATQELESALGDGVKRVEGNEQETVIIQRRALRLKTALPEGTVIQKKHLDELRPCPRGACSPDRVEEVVGRRLNTAKETGEALLWNELN